jgi:transcription elongation factor GreB
MGRWRPPPPKSSPYITGEGFKTLQTEQETLWERRKHVTKALSEAAAEGDRSENAEYIYRKKELREIDRRIRYLQKRLPVLKVVTEKPTFQEQIFFGAWVTLENDQGEEVRYRIVGPDEIGTKDHISMDAPLARALLKKNIDDEVKIKTEFGEYWYLVVNIEY